MTPEDARRRVRDARVGRLATMTPDGRLHLVPMCYVLDAETVYSAVDHKPKTTRRLQRLRNIEAHPGVALLVDHYDEDWEQVWWVRLRGEARTIREGAEYTRAVDLLGEKYAQYRERPPGGPVIAIGITEWRGWSAQDGGL